MFTLSENGIKKVQKNASKEMIQFFKVLTDFGGSKEFLVLVAVSFVFGTRSKCFYYLVCMMMDKVINAYMKLVYHQPRPFMID